MGEHSFCRYKQIFGSLTLALLVFFASAAQGQPTCTLTGTIKDKRTGTPLVGANVIIKGSLLGGATGPNGFYKISNIPQGEQTIVVSYIGYHTTETTLNLRLAGLVGKIIDNTTGNSLPGIEITIKGTDIVAITDNDGKYVFENMPPGEYVLEVGRQGYEPMEAVTSISPNKLDVNLGEDIIRGEEIVVTGIASRTSKAKAEVSVSRLPVKDYVEINTYGTAMQLLNGKIAGVQVKPVSGNVGAGFRFNVRSGGGLNGDGQPVIYLDGVRIENSEIIGFEVGGQGIGLLADLNAEEIESVEVLKGPAGSASYGTSGSNGVILITTKRGNFNEGRENALALNYKVVTGVNTQASKYSKKDYRTASEINDIFRNGNITQNSLSASGGSNLIRYFTSFDSRIEDGILKTNDFDRKNIRANIDVIPSEQFNINVSSSYTYGLIRRPANDNSQFGYLFNTIVNPEPYFFVGGGKSAIDNISDENQTKRFIGSVRAEYKPTDYFTGRMSLGIDDHDFRQDQHYPVSETYSDELFDSGVRNIFTRNSRLATYGLDGRLFLQPSRNLDVSVMAGIQLFDRRLNIFGTQRSGFLTDLIDAIDAGSETILIEETTGHEREAGVFGEAAFNYLDQYYFTAKIRRDYASRIGLDAATILYPGASFAWRLDRFNSFPSVFNLFKLRAAYGETGILPRSLDGIRVLFEPESGGYGVGGVPGSIGNDKIKPERVKELEFGIDLEFINNYALELTYYRQKSTDSILEFRNSPSSGLTVTSVPVNVGEIKGSGLETLLRASLYKDRNIDLSFMLINNFQTNEVTDMGDAQPIFDAFGLNVIDKGLAKHEFYSEKFLGAVFGNNGAYLGPDFSDEREALGNPTPSYTGSLGLNLNVFKNLNFYAMFDWATGHKIWNGNQAFVNLAGNNPRYNLLANQLNIAGTAEIDGVAELVPVNQDITPLQAGTAEYAAAAEEFSGMDPLLDSNFIEDADFLKLREVSVSYSLRDVFPKMFGTTGYFKNVVLTFSALNVFTSTKYSGSDPEVNWSGARELERGQDLFTLQNPRTYNLSLRFSL